MSYITLENFRKTEFENKTEEEIFLLNEKYIKATIRRQYSNLEYYHNNHRFEYDDLYAFGCEGLIKAIRRYDSLHGVKFSTFAIKYIKGYISNRIKTDSMSDKTEDGSYVISLDTPIGDDDDSVLIESVKNDIWTSESTNKDLKELELKALNLLNKSENIDSELYSILSYRLQGKDNVEIARILNKNKSSIGRRLKSKRAMEFREELIKNIRNEVV